MTPMHLQHEDPNRNTPLQNESPAPKQTPRAQGQSQSVPQSSSAKAPAPQLAAHLSEHSPGDTALGTEPWGHSLGDTAPGTPQLYSELLSTSKSKALVVS